MTPGYSYGRWLLAKSCLTLTTPRTVAHQAPLSMGILQAHRYACIGKDTAYIGFGTIHGFWNRPGALKSIVLGYGGGTGCGPGPAPWLPPSHRGSLPPTVVPPTVAPSRDKETHGRPVQLPLE